MTEDLRSIVRGLTPEEKARLRRGLATVKAALRVAAQSPAAPALPPLAADDTECQQILKQEQKA